MSEKTTAVTPEKLAGFGIRLLAYFVDFFILYFVGFFLPFLYGSNPFAFFSLTSLEEIDKLNQANASHVLPLFGLSILLSFLFYLFFWAKYGATPGKLLLGLRIVKEDGSPIGIGTALLRYIGYILSSLSVFIFGLGFLWIIWDKKKQAWHDKIAKTVVVHTGKQPNYVLPILVVTFGLIFYIAYMMFAVIQGFRIGFEAAKKDTKPSSSSSSEMTMIEYKNRILSYAPSACDLSVPVPKTTDTYQGKERKWLYEEIPLSATNFRILDKDVYPITEVQGAFIGYKETDKRLGGASFSVAYPGLNIYCIENIKNLSLDEYQSLALANKDLDVTIGRKIRGEVNLIEITLDGKDETGKPYKDFGLIGLTKDGKKLLYIRVWGVEKTDPQATELSKDIDAILETIHYRKTPSTKSNNMDDIEENVKGVSTSTLQAKPSPVK